MGSKPRAGSRRVADRRGLLVVFEGLDGAGKSTQIRVLAERLIRLGHDVVCSREPTDGPWGQKIRASAQTGRMSPSDELAAFVADRRDHVESLIKPSLEAGRIVLLDRYYFSTAAYQGARGLDVADVLAANDFAPAPDVLLLFDLDPELGLARVVDRGLGSDLFEKESELRRAREIFLSLDAVGLKVLDAGRSADVVAEEVWRHVATAVGERSTSLATSPRDSPR